MSTSPITNTNNYECDGHRYHNDHNNHNNDHVLNALNQLDRSNLQATAHATSSIIAENERTAFSVRDTIEKQSISNRDAIERTGNANSVAIERNGASNLTATERTGTANLLSTERNGGDIRHIMQQIAGENRDIMYQHNTQHLLSSKDILLEINKNTCHLERQASDNYANIQLEACKNKASLELEALKNKESLAAQLAACCCEMKESLLASASNTQLLIRDIESNKVRDALNASTTENLILRLSGNGGGNNRPS